MYAIIFLAKFRKLSGHLLGNSCSTGTIYLSQLRDVTKALPGKLPVQIKFRLFPIDCNVRDVLF